MTVLFRTMDALLAQLENSPKIIVIDFHAEATSEKEALGRYLDGRVSAVLGTHTHVGTIDARILHGGTAYVTDIGLTGPIESVIGDDPENVLKRFLTQMHIDYLPVWARAWSMPFLSGWTTFTGKAISIERIQRETE